MMAVPGGEFWMGSAPGKYAPDESPRFRTKVADFCMDATEVTVSSYRRCVAAGACPAAFARYKRCNYGRSDREDHPINCVDWHQASAFCAWRQARLPTEVEWEYAARGGSALRRYPWGSEGVDGHACWKQSAGTCATARFAPGAFGLYDMSGNVWEWVSDGYGPYPWPAPGAPDKVYRGGSWSRRFEKWMHTRLRNRWPPQRWGSHLGFRCASTPPGTECPYGVDPAGGCRRGVEAVECPERQTFNGHRCAAQGAPPCPNGLDPGEGFGCAPEPSAKQVRMTLDLSAVRRERSPEFDEDCQTNYPGRPQAYRLSGGAHEARNVVGQRAGCKNRDVGVGWNSTCCP
jgi:sulfatase modifying factor 1